MKILIVCSINSGRISPFVSEQAESLQKKGCEIDYFTISGKGFKGYLQNRKKLILKIKEYKPDIIHAHYGLSGLLANLQQKIPVVTTYHGSDIYNKQVFRFSRLSIALSSFNIFVSQKNIDIAKPKKNFALIPCGVNIDLFKPLDKEFCRNKLGFQKEDKLVLFSGSFDDKVKNSPLAKEAVALLPGVKLIELKGYSRIQVCELINAVDSVLMTSLTEGSPQLIKEAMACNCPVVSVDVGDVKNIISDVNGCYITSYESKKIAGNIQQTLDFEERTNGWKNILNLGLDLESVANKVLDIYRSAVKNKTGN